MKFAKFPGQFSIYTDQTIKALNGNTFRIPLTLKRFSFPFCSHLHLKFHVTIFSKRFVLQLHETRMLQPCNTTMGKTTFLGQCEKGVKGDKWILGTNEKTGRQEVQGRNLQKCILREGWCWRASYSMLKHYSQKVGNADFIPNLISLQETWLL